MEHPQVLEALTTKSIYELSVDEKIKILNCLMQQIMSFATVRDVIDENFAELHEAKINLRNHQWEESRRQKQIVEEQKQKRKKEANEKKEEELKAQEQAAADKPKENGVEEGHKAEEFPPEVTHLTERQRLAIQTKKEQEEKDKQKKEDIIR